MNIMVSVIIPAYNVAQYLDRCLESVLCQSFLEFEVIIIDDGSTDETASVCKRWKEKDRRIRFYSKNNEGQGPARDMGVHIAEGKYIFFLDADDWIVPNCLEQLVRAAEETQADMVIFDYFLTKRSETGGFIHQPAPRHLCLADTGVTLKEHPELLSRCGGTVWNKFQKKDFIQKNGIHHPSHRYEDISYVYQMLTRAGRIVHLPELLYYYWINRPESTTNKKPYISDCFMALDEMQEIIKGYPYRESCCSHLMKYSAAYLQIPLQRVGKDRGKEIKSIWTEYYRRFPLAERIDQLKFILVGSENLKAVFQRMRFLNTECVSISMQEVLLGDAEISTALSGAKFDYLLMDLEELASVEHDDKRCCQEKYRLLAEAVEKVWNHGSGVYLLGTGSGEEPKNRQAEAAEQYFISRLPEICLLKGPQGEEERRKNIYWHYNRADELREILLRRCVSEMTQTTS